MQFNFIFLLLHLRYFLFIIQFIQFLISIFYLHLKLLKQSLKVILNLVNLFNTIQKVIMQLLYHMFIHTIIIL